MRVEAVEKVGLILAIISGPREDRSALIVLETSVMARRDVIDVSRGGEIHEAPNLHSLVTADTGIGCCAGRIAVKKIVNDSFPKGVTGIDDFVGDVEKFGDVLGDADLTTSSFLPFFGCCDGFVLVFPYLEGNAVHLVALANEQCGCDGAVNSAAHTEEDGWASHWTGIVPGGVDKGLEVDRPSFASMGCQIMDILG